MWKPQGHQLTCLLFPVASVQLFLKIYLLKNHFHVNPTEADLHSGPTTENDDVAKKESRK